MMKNSDNDRLLAHKRRVDAQRRAKAVDRDVQFRLRARYMMARVAKASGV